MTYDGWASTPPPFKFTTGVSVVPDVLPHKWSQATAKLGPEPPPE
jgi:hypothetical protein